MLKARVILLHIAAGVTDCGHVFIQLKTVLKACLILVHVHCHVCLNWFLAEVRNHQAHLEVLLGPQSCRIVQFLFICELAFQGNKPNGYVRINFLLLQLNTLSLIEIIEMLL